MIRRITPIKFFFVVVLLLSNVSWAQAQPLKPLFTQPYIIVYGRDSCPYTSNLRRELKREGIKFQYKIIDNPKVQKLIHRRMKLSGYSIKEFVLPVVDVNNVIMVHPSPDKVMDQYNFGAE